MNKKRIACWMSDKKLQKINWSEFEKVCTRYGFELFKLDLTKNLEFQGTFSVLLHKLTDIIASADKGNLENRTIIDRIEKYLDTHPSTIVIDPLNCVRGLLNRHNCYVRINTATDLNQYGIFAPTSCEIHGDMDENEYEIAKQLNNANITYPFVCKPILGHGSPSAHEMALVFSERHLKDCRPPFVAQAFINHNAILYKIFVVGNKFEYVERPSLKNFHPDLDDDDATIFFDSGEVSKAGSMHSLSRLDNTDYDAFVLQEQDQKPDLKTFQRIVSTLRPVFGMDLLGIDVVIENRTGKYAIIDVNVFPGYDGFSNFFDALLECISEKVERKMIK